ncbi:MAG: PIN domain-containing protein [Chloroflexi bacterium]|nr:PIN domain-containing protein [Chloroflexota bacterium]
MALPKRIPKLFLDASVFVAAAGSPSGGSLAVLDLCRRGHFEAVTTRLILLEAEKNIREKLPREALLRFYRGLGTLPLTIQEPASGEDNDTYTDLIDEKDAHVLAAAVKSGSDWLLTLDRRHFMTPKLRRARLKVLIATPGEFLRQL